MKSIIKFLSISIVGAVALVGCGQKATGVTNVSTTVESGNTASKTQEVAAVEESVAQEGTTDAQYPLTYVDATGEEVVIEKKPERMASNYVPYWEYLMALDTPPIATAYAQHYRDTWVPFQSYDISGVIDLGEGEMNLEKLAEVSPDLILVAKYDAGVENLKKIAPVIVLDPQVRVDWRFGVREIGKVIGESEAAENKVQEMEKKIEDARARLTEKYENETVMVVSIMGKDRYFCARRPDFFDAEVGLGLVAPEGYPLGNDYEQVALEAFAQMDPDHIFLVVFEGDEAIVEELKDSSIWKSLTAAQNDQVYILNGAAHAASILATEYTVDAIVTHLLEE
jgi:iron complex transport system substrate-binding protein